MLGNSGISWPERFVLTYRIFMSFVKTVEVFDSVLSMFLESKGYWLVRLFTLLLIKFLLGLRSVTRVTESIAVKWKASGLVYLCFNCLSDSLINWFVSNSLLARSVGSMPPI